MKKFKLESIMAILMFHLMAIDIYYINFYSLIKLIIIFLIGIYILRYSKIIISQENFSIKFSMLLFGSAIIISSIINRHVLVTPLNGFVYTLKIWESILFFLIINKKGEFRNIMNIFYKITLFYVILTDILLIFLPRLYIIYERNYLIGNKFEVVYLHIFLICLYLYISKNKKSYCIMIAKNKKLKMNSFIHTIYWLITLIISVKIECSTGIVCCIIIAIFVFFEATLKYILNKWWIFLISTAFFDSIMFFSQEILNNSYVQLFITQVLQRDLGLTGRTVIYSKILPVVFQELWWGYGQGNSFYIINSQLNGFPNAQNGILQCCINFGVVGVIAMLVMYCLILHKKKTSIQYPILIMIYLYVIISSIEITFELNMIFLFAILCGTIKNDISCMKEDNLVE